MYMNLYIVLSMLINVSACFQVDAAEPEALEEVTEQAPVESPVEEPEPVESPVESLVESLVESPPVEEVTEQATLESPVEELTFSTPQPVPAVHSTAVETTTLAVSE